MRITVVGLGKIGLPCISRLTANEAEALLEIREAA